MNPNFKRQVRVQSFELGKIYIVFWCNQANRMMSCKFIKPTRCGYNLLDLNTNKCILKKHLYPSKKLNKEGEPPTKFFVNKNLKIQ